MLNHYNRVAEITQLFEYVNKSFCISGVQTDRRFVQHIKRPDQTAAQRFCQADTLALTSRKRVTHTAKCEIAESHVFHKPETGGNLMKKHLCCLLVSIIERKGSKPFRQIGDRHRTKVGYILAVDTHVLCLFAKTHTITIGADGFAFVTCEHHAVLYLAILLCLQLLEEIVQSTEIFIACPNKSFLLLCKFDEWGVYREIELRGIVDKAVAPYTHFFSVPTGDSVIINGFRFVWDNQVGVDTDDIPETFTSRTGTDRVVEIEEMFAWFHKANAIHLETLGEHFIIAVDVQSTLAVSFEDGGLYRVSKTVRRGRFAIYYYTVYQQIDMLFEYSVVSNLLACGGSQTHHIAIIQQAGESLALPYIQLLLQCSVFQNNRRNQIDACSIRLRCHRVHYIAYALAAYFFAANRRVGMSDTGKKEFEIIVYLGACSYSGTWVVTAHFLLNGNSRRNTFYLVHFGFLHTPEELACVGTQALYIAALPLGIERIKRQRRFAATAHTCNHNKLITRYVHAYML